LNILLKLLQYAAEKKTCESFISGTGIPVEKQHLIWKSVELEDKVTIADYKLTSGTTLQLVTAMRGGPLNIRRGNCFLHRRR